MRRGTWAPCSFRSFNRACAETQKCQNCGSFHCCERTAKALARLRGYAGSPDPSMFVNAILTLFTRAGSLTSIKSPAQTAPRHEKTCLRGLQPGKTQTSLLSYRVGWLCWGLTSQSTIFQSCRDGAIASWVINQYFRGVKCLAQGHNTAAVGQLQRLARVLKFWI